MISMLSYFRSFSNFQNLTVKNLNFLKMLSLDMKTKIIAHHKKPSQNKNLSFIRELSE